jgi:hypothetical protein
MYRNRNLDIAIATIIAVLGGLAAAKQLPGQITIPLGIGLFFAPGYLWSEAILNQWLPGLERALTSVGMALVFPILGGFLFFGLHIPLFRSSWIGLLVVLTLLGVVAVAVQRLSQPPAVRRPPRPVGQQQPGRGNQPPPRRGGSIALNASIFGLAGLVAIGAVAYSVKSAEAQKFPGYTMLSMTPVVDNPLAQNIAALSNNLAAQNQAAEMQDTLQGKATQAHLFVADHQGVPEQYELKLLEKAKVVKTWPITLNDGQSWQVTVGWTTNYSMIADLYLLPNTTTPFHYVNNGACVSAPNPLPVALQAEAPCSVKT